jgi:hypothetical protein
MLLASTHNVMVVYISEQCFAYECYADQIACTDCRIPTTTGQSIWTCIDLNCTEVSTVQMYMRDAGHHFGKLDFLWDAEGLCFLELNPNGLYAWLDPQGSEGVLKAIAAEIMQVHSWQVRRSDSGPARSPPHP